MSTRYLDAKTIRIEFDDATWLNAFPSIYTVTNDATHAWYVNNTFTYNSKNTLRSGIISDNQSTAITFTFTLTTAGTIALEHIVSSESGYDKLYIFVDNVSVNTSSGSPGWTQYTKTLAAGQHTIKFEYSKDNSNSSGEDAAGIGYIDITGVIASYTAYYLIYDEIANKYYANIDGTLTEQALTTHPTLADYKTYGGILPTDIMLQTFQKYKLLCGADTVTYADIVPSIKVKCTVNPKPTMLICSKTVSTEYEYQLGFSQILAEFTALSTTSLKLVISPDGTNWSAFDGTAWHPVDATAEAILTSGMTINIAQALTADNMNLLFTATPKVLHVAFAINSTAVDTWTFKRLVVKFAVSNT